MLEVLNLSKQFQGKQVLQELSFAVEEHSIYGFIGKNGAGKTTTMKLILGLLKADAGEIYIHEMPVKYGSTKTNQWIGYLPDVPEFYGFMSAYEYMDLCAKVTGLQERNTRKKILELLAQVGLQEDKKKIAGYSRGMKQRLGIAQALLNEPKLFICDEPTSALDPEGRKEVLDIMESVKEKTTILFSTHILSDVERICDKVGLLNHGKIEVSGTLLDLQKNMPQKGFEIEFVKEEDRQCFFKLFDEEKKQFLGKEEMELALSICVKAHLTPIRLEKSRADLEDLFLEVIKK